MKGKRGMFRLFLIFILDKLQAHSPSKLWTYVAMYRYRTGHILLSMLLVFLVEVQNITKVTFHVYFGF